MVRNRTGKKKIQSRRKSTVSVRNYKKNLYSALLYLYQFHDLKDFLFLKNKVFLELCEVSWIDWSFKKDWLIEELSGIQGQKSWPFQFFCPLNYKDSHYGELIFFSSCKFLQNKKRFLKKVSFSVASTLYFLESREKTKNIKSQWAGVFDSFSQAFCITNKNLEIIRYNKSFQEIRNKRRKAENKKLFEVFPGLKNLFKGDEQEGAFLLKEQSTCWKVSFKTLLLKKENAQTFLFLIKDITKEMEIEEELSVQAKDREVGFIKGSIAHELNNPIAGIQLLLEVLEREAPKDKTLVIDSLKEMKKSVHICQQIINKILCVSKHKENTVSALSSP